MGKLKDKKGEVFSWFGVINHPKKENASKGDFEAFNEILNKYYRTNYFFATIIHDKDKLEDGEIKTIHQHLYLTTREQAYTQAEILEKLSHDFNIPSECISIEPVISPYASIRYLTHRDQKWKTQYNPNEIFTNDTEELSKLWRSDLEILQQSATYEEVVDNRGLEFLRKNLGLYKEVRPEQIRHSKELILIRLYRQYFDKLNEILHSNRIDWGKVKDEMDDLAYKIDMTESEIKDLMK